MEDFLRSCVDRYRELTGVTTPRRASTPILPEPTRPDFSSADTDSVDEPTVEAALQALRDVIDGPDHDSTTTTTTPATTEEGVNDPNVPTQLAVYAAKVLMKILYAARFARFDLLRAVCVLAQRVSKWDRSCDVKLYRLICYINCSYHVRMTGWIGDPPEMLAPHIFADADFAGCSKTSRSTSGAHLSLLVLTLFGLSPDRVRSRDVFHTALPRLRLLRQTTRYARSAYQPWAFGERF